MGQPKSPYSVTVTGAVLGPRLRVLASAESLDCGIGWVVNRTTPKIATATIPSPITSQRRVVDEVNVILVTSIPYIFEAAGVGAHSAINLDELVDRKHCT